MVIKTDKTFAGRTAVHKIILSESDRPSKYSKGVIRPGFRNKILLKNKLRSLCTVCLGVVTHQTGHNLVVIKGHNRSSWERNYDLSHPNPT